MCSKRIITYGIICLYYLLSGVEYGKLSISVKNICGITINMLAVANLATMKLKK